MLPNKKEAGAECKTICVFVDLQNFLYFFHLYTMK